MFGSRDMKFNRQNFFVILGNFLPLYLPNTLKNEKKTLEISSFYTSASKIMITCYSFPELWDMKDVIVIFILGYQAFFQAFFYIR